MIDLYAKSKKKGNAVSNEGGPVNLVSDLEFLERFLLIGATNGTFYAEKRAHAEESLEGIEKAVLSHGMEAVDLIVSAGQNAPKHENILVAYATAVSSPDDKVRAYALSKFNDVIRTGTHLFHFAEYIKGRRGWGTGLRKRVNNWYLGKSDIALAMQLIKYKQRDGWTHRDIFRLSHPVPRSQTQQSMIAWSLGNPLLQDDSSAHALIEVSDRIHTLNNAREVAQMVREYQLPREVVPSEFLKDAEVWEALLPHMGQTAMLRNLRTMYKVGLMTQGSDATRFIVDSLSDANWLRKGRIHPVAIFLAKQNAMYDKNMNAYYRAPMPGFPQPVVNVLEKAFYDSFDNLQGTNKRIMLALDVSYSMSSPVPGMAIMSSEWAALMAMVNARQAPHAEFYGFSTSLIPLDISPNDSMERVQQKMSGHTHGGTNCAAPFQYARKNGLKFDAFAIYTDNETHNLGYVPDELQSYRRSSGINAKLIVSATELNNITIGDNNDPNTLGVVGLSVSAPQAIENFINL